MGYIEDVLFLDPEGISLIKSKYPQCTFTNLTNTTNPTQRYKLVIPIDDPDHNEYYIFLLDNLIAMSSTNFLARLNRDEYFSRKMLARFKSNLEKFGSKTL
jgi:hypothetical protein